LAGACLAAALPAPDLFAALVTDAFFAAGWWAARFAEAFLGGTFLTDAFLVGAFFVAAISGVPPGGSNVGL
jgi:hypothetical protein